jgi:hypothetical protein
VLPVRGGRRAVRRHGCRAAPRRGSRLGSPVARPAPRGPAGPRAGCRSATCGRSAGGGSVPRCGWRAGTGTPAAGERPEIRSGRRLGGGGGADAARRGPQVGVVRRPLCGGRTPAVLARRRRPAQRATALPCVEPVTGAPPVVLACTPGELHSLPLEALTAALAERGLPTRTLGTAVPAEALLACVRRTGPAAVVLWAQARSTASGPLARHVAAMEWGPAGARGRPLVLPAGPGWDRRTSAGFPRCSVCWTPWRPWAPFTPGARRRPRRHAERPAPGERARCVQPGNRPELRRAQRRSA